MTAAKAIEIIALLLHEQHFLPVEDKHIAVSIALEALKAHQEANRRRFAGMFDLLPGETEP